VFVFFVIRLASTVFVNGRRRCPTSSLIVNCHLCWSSTVPVADCQIPPSLLCLLCPSLIVNCPTLYIYCVCRLSSTMFVDDHRLSPSLSVYCVRRWLSTDAIAVHLPCSLVNCHRGLPSTCCSVYCRCSLLICLSPSVKSTAFCPSPSASGSG